MALNRFALNPRTQTVESGKYYSGKEKADKGYASELQRSTSPYTAQGVLGRQQAAAGKTGTGATKLTPIGGGSGSGTSFMQVAEDAAVTQAEAELQDEIAESNEAQAARTAEYAQAIGTAARPPGGSIRRGTTTIGQASGAGLAQANAAARRKTKIDAAKARAKLAVAETAMNRNKNARLG
jgi:hypothetical protein